MTLFKKVFQNQARPAIEEEGLEEDALRSALTDDGLNAEPLELAPFAESTALMPEVEPTEEFDEMEEGIFADDDILDQPWPETQDEETSHIEDDTAETLEDDLDAVQLGADLLPEPNHETDCETDDPEEDAFSEFNQSDEEIAACLNRAMSAGAEVSVPIHEEFDADTPEECADALLRMDELDAGDALESSDPDMLQPADPQESEHSRDSEAAVLDIAAFAKEQMGSLNAADAGVDKDGPEVPSVTLDLSNGAIVPDDGLAPAVGRSGRRAGRVKTRLLGFNRNVAQDSDPFEQVSETTASVQHEKFPVGWLVIVDGPGRGHSFSLFSGASVIGRGEGQVIRLDFGDNSISRDNHAAIAYDDEQNKFYIGHGGKSNIIRRNARPVLSTEELAHADLIRIGETTLRFVALCGSDFQWEGAGDDYASGL